MADPESHDLPPAWMAPAFAASMGLAGMCVAYLGFVLAAWLFR